MAASKQTSQMSGLSNRSLNRSKPIDCMEPVNSGRLETKQTDAFDGLGGKASLTFKANQLEV